MNTTTSYQERRYISCTDTAKLVRQALKDAFKENYPSVKFSVKSREYSMGASIDVSWTDGPTSQVVKRIIDTFQGADFDGMQDMKISRESALNGEPVHFCADYVTPYRAHSPALVTAVTKAYCERYKLEMPEIKESCGSGYIDHYHKLRDTIMPLAYSCDGNDVENLTLCVYHGEDAIKTPGMQEDKVCACCHFYAASENVQYINNLPICDLCIKNEVKTLTAEDLEAPADMQESLVVGDKELTSHLDVELQQLKRDVETASNVIDIRTRKPVPTPIAVVKQPTRQPDVKMNVSPALPKGEAVKYQILDILKRGRIEGCNYYLPQGQLERKVYVEVNEVLDRIGGKWNKKAKAHIFEEDPTELLNLVYETEEMPPKNPTAFFPTPDSVIAEMPFHLMPYGTERILEPSAGKGAIAEVIRHHCSVHKIEARLDVVEILPKFRTILKNKGFNVVEEPDFLAYKPEQSYDAILMNPPFNLEGDTLAYITHIEHAWSMLAEGGVLVAIAPGGASFKTDKRTAAFRAFVEEHGEIQKLASGAFKESGTGANTVMIILQK